MKTRKLIFGAMIGFVLVALLSCEKEEQMLDFYLVDVQDHTEWDYLAFGKDGSYMLIHQECIPPLIIYFVPEKDDIGYPIFFNDEGFPEMAVVKDHIFLFHQVDNRHVDIAMVSPEGEILITRGIDQGFDWNTVGTKIDAAEETLTTLVRWSGQGVSLVATGLGAKAVAATGAIPVPHARWGHEARVVSFAAQAIEPEAFVLESAVVSRGLHLIGCRGVPLSCVSGLEDYATGYVNDANEAKERNQASVRAAIGAMQTGHGEVQVTLTWNNIADLDLHVIDPDGVEIYYAMRTSPSGGHLDYDNTYGYGPENIFWPPDGAPQGTYQVFVNHYSGSNASRYTVLVNAFGHFATFQGTVQPRQKLFVTNFSPSGIGSKSVQDPVEAPYVKGPAK